MQALPQYTPAQPCPPIQRTEEGKNDARSRTPLDETQRRLAVQGAPPRAVRGGGRQKKKVSPARQLDPDFNAKGAKEELPSQEASDLAVGTSASADDDA